MKFSTAAQQNIDETGINPMDDVSALRAGTHTRESLLAHCLDGADEDRVEGWREYVDTICEEAEPFPSKLRDDGRVVVRNGLGKCLVADEAAAEAGRAWAEREAEALDVLPPTWRSADLDALALVEASDDAERRRLARIANRAARARWAELAAMGASRTG